MPKRFIIRYRGKGPRPATEHVSSLKVIDDTSRMLLVEGHEDDIRNAYSTDDWLVTPEVRVDSPIERPPRIEKEPDES
jgi:hypothetical protein